MIDFLRMFSNKEFNIKIKIQKIQKYKIKYKIILQLETKLHIKKAVNYKKNNTNLKIKVHFKKLGIKVN